MLRSIVLLGKSVMQVGVPSPEWKRPRRSMRAVCRPKVEQLEDRRVLNCGTLAPWCLAAR